MSNSGVVVALNSKISCDRCGVKQSCLGRDLHACEPARLGEIKGPPRLYRRGDHLFRVGDSFESLYVIRSGAIKTYLISEDGEEQIIGFYGPGETIGFGAIANGQYRCNATALDTSSICKVSFEAVSRLCDRSPDTLRELIRGISAETVRLAEMMLLLGKKTADQRVASFLLSQSGHQHERGYSATALTLSMSRADIGRYLGLTVETVSRVLTRFQAQGALTKDRKQIRIRNLKTLQRIVGESGGDVFIEPTGRTTLAS